LYQTSIAIRRALRIAWSTLIIRRLGNRSAIPLADWGI